MPVIPRPPLWQNRTRRLTLKTCIPPFAPMSHSLVLLRVPPGTDPRWRFIGRVRRAARARVIAHARDIVSNWYMKDADALERAINIPRRYQKYIGHIAASAAVIGSAACSGDRTTATEHVLRVQGSG